MTDRKLRIPVLLLVIVMVLSNAYGGLAAPAPGPSAAPPALGQPQAAGQPGVLDIPLGRSAPKLDGFCNDYLDASKQVYQDGNNITGTVFLKASGAFLFVCMQAPKGTFDEQFGSLYLDPQADGSAYTFADKGDLAFHLAMDGTRTSFRGSGVMNGWTQDTTLDAKWLGAVGVGETTVSFEYQVNLDSLNFGFNCELFGIAAYHHWFSAVGDDYGWPSNKYFDQPRTWQLSRIFNSSCDLPKSGKIAYVFRGSRPPAISFFNLLTGAGYSVQLIPLNSVLLTDFTLYDLILIADDTGSLDQWGLPGLTAAEVAKISVANRPMIGLGEGGYAFFGRMPIFIGWPNGWHGPQDRIFKAATAPPAFYTGITTAEPIPLYAPPVNEVGIFLGGGGPPADVVPVGLEPTKDHAPLIQQGCRTLWGFSGSPDFMTADGKAIFLNAVGYMRGFSGQCPPPTTQKCIIITKEANIPAGTAVKPGDTIIYTITVSYVCDTNNPAKLVDFVPPDTIFVPGSAGKDLAGAPITPGPDGALVWVVPRQAAPQTFSFSVVVAQSICAGQRTVINRATIYGGMFGTFTSDPVIIPVDCTGVTYPNHNPPYAEGEISINPYPLIAGLPSDIQVKVSNDSDSAQTLEVSFQTSADKFGIGLDFGEFAHRTVTLPAHTNAILHGTYVPVASGHYCIQIVVTGGNLTAPLITQRNIDVTEDLKPGVADILPFTVRNNSSITADVVLVVDNTCPGFTAAIVDPPGGVLTNMAPGEKRTAKLSVTPPNPVNLGSGCHIDVQAWINGQLIGGIRKLDVPPVHLPPDVDPPYAEKEIGTVPLVLSPGVKGQVYVMLQNPTPITRTVTVDFAAADFGAGVPFTNFATGVVFTLPPNSLRRYYTDWTPLTTGTLHRCLLVTLHQDGYQDERSQHNVDLVRLRPTRLGDLDYPFVVFNPDLVDHTLTFSMTVFGIDPYWEPVIVPINPGDPPPDMIMAGQTLNLRLLFVPRMGAKAPIAPPPNYHFGDASVVDVTTNMDGQSMGGFELQFELPPVFLPIILRPPA